MTDSPFISGTNLQWVWDSVSLNDAKTCLRKYFYTMIEGWQPRAVSFHLDFGIWYHSALEQYDKMRAKDTPPEEAILEVVRDLLIKTWIEESCTECAGKGYTSAYSPDNEQDTCPVCKGDGYIGGHPALTFQNESGEWLPIDPNKNRETLVRSVVWYLDQFGEADPAKTLTLPNGAPAVELTFKMETEIALPLSRVTTQGRYILSGHLDRVVIFDGDPYVMDRKTTKSTISPYYFKRYNPDNQMSLYSLAASLVFHAPVKGVIIDAAQIAVGFTSFSRGVVTRTSAQLDEWLRDLEPILRGVEKAAETGHWPMNDTACDKYGGCAFRDICSKDPGVRDQFLKSNYVERRWNPLQVR